ncbi:RDD family protein [Streptomyces sp. NPDC056468]|uniref:RDD family protein n=1 Tax=Streptomyces sp. NPDC056468 TaxID=3345830 RepID=UPI003686DEBF
MADAPAESYRSLNSLYAQQRSALVGYARRKLREAEVPESAVGAEDVVQNAFAKAYRDPARIHQPRAYVYELIRNEVLAYARRRSRPDGKALVISCLEEVDPTAAIEERCDVQRALGDLPVQQRTAVYVVKALGFRQDEAAVLMGKRPGTVATHVARATITLRAVLSAMPVVVSVMVLGVSAESIRRYSAASQTGRRMTDVLPGLGPVVLWAVLALLLLGATAALSRVLPKSRRANGPSEAELGAGVARPAALPRRLLARLIDYLAAGVVFAPIAVSQGTAAFQHLQGKVASARQSGVTATVWLIDGTTAAQLAVLASSLILTGLLLEALPTALWGRTLGKRLLGLRVLDIESHTRPAPAPAVQRALIHIVLNVLTVGVVGLLWCLADRPWRQCWHDKAARTFVSDDQTFRRGGSVHGSV